MKDRMSLQDTKATCGTQSADTRSGDRHSRGSSGTKRHTTGIFEREKRGFVGGLNVASKAYLIEHGALKLQLTMRHIRRGSKKLPLGPPITVRRAARSDRRAVGTRRPVLAVRKCGPLLPAKTSQFPDQQDAPLLFHQSEELLQKKADLPVSFSPYL